MGFWETFYDYMYFQDMVGAGSGLGTIGLANALSRKPILSRVPLMVLGTAVGYGFGVKIRHLTEGRIMERERVIRDYIRLHPEDFPELERKKYKDVILEWHPIR